MRIELHTLREITNNFSDKQKLGNEEHGPVFKGVYNGEEIAVKMLHDGADESQFENEFLNLSSINHPHIVKLIGYCYEIHNEHVEYNGKLRFPQRIYRAICLEYLQGGSLDMYLTACYNGSRNRDWRTLFNIIKGACEGLYFLHEGCGTPIVHMGLKPANILLDDNMVAKIADFGLSRLFQEASESVTGTTKYMAPEYKYRKMISPKNDVYSLGVTMIEVMAGPTGYDRFCQMGDVKKFIDQVNMDWAKQINATASLCASTETDQVDICITIAMKCVHAERNNRPTVAEIVHILKETEKKFVKESINHTQFLMDQVVRTSQGLYTETVHEDSSYMELNILERIVNESEEPSPLDFALLHSITENFSEKNKIGSGGCGIVYKGILRNGVVAVKKLHNSRTIKNKMFHREVLNLISVKHQNIVRFLGYCSFTKEYAVPYEGITIMADIRERLLCFEYIRNGSLDKHLSDELRGLKWQTRCQIIIGICRGLHYLHKDKKIIHMDLKPGNILLDDLMVPKITDFGLSRSISDTQATTTLLISQGYAAPEYISGGKATSPSDIYSLGVIIIELVTGSRTEPNITKISPCCLEDILGIEPLEVHIPSEDFKVSHSIELTNDTDDYIAFVTKAKLDRFCTEPDKGIVPPRSNCSVTLAMQAHVNVVPNKHYTEVITVLSTRVDGALATMDTVTAGDIFIDSEEGKVVDEVNVIVVFGMPEKPEEE